ncbi:cytochrome P450 [Daldinia sp. FL1419]|nr:cytochrome P450 [Daldinia sp. FL1419]
MRIIILLCVIITYYMLLYAKPFSPLTKIPGPKLAGQYVRVRPDVVHINDPTSIEKLYSQSPKQRCERYWTIPQTLQATGSILATQDHELHRKRRVPVINDALANLFYRMDGWAKTGEPVRMNVAFRAATKDTIQAYAFGEGDKCLDKEDCNTAFFDISDQLAHLGTHFFWLATFLNNLPPKLMTILVPKIGVFADFVEIFHEIIRSDIPESEKQTHRLTEEAMMIVIAGSETTASTLAAIMYRLLSDRILFNRLRAELETAMPDCDELPIASKLDSLPLLNAIIEEALRLYPVATHRQDRTCPNEDLVYEAPNGRIRLIPAGSSVGMAALILNRNPGFYDQPDEFRPERYLEDPNLSKYHISLSKGTRQCIGINLAYQELQTFTAGIIRRYDLYDPTKQAQSGPTLELYRTTRADVSMYSDFIATTSYKGSPGLRVMIRN